MGSQIAAGTSEIPSVQASGPFDLLARRLGCAHDRPLMQVLRCQPVKRGNLWQCCVRARSLPAC